MKARKRFLAFISSHTTTGPQLVIGGLVIGLLGIHLLDCIRFGGQVGDWPLFCYHHV